MHSAGKHRKRRNLSASEAQVRRRVRKLACAAMMKIAAAAVFVAAGFMLATWVGLLLLAFALFRGADVL